MSSQCSPRVRSPLVEDMLTGLVVMDILKVCDSLRSKAKCKSEVQVCRKIMYLIGYFKKKKDFFSLFFSIIISDLHFPFLKRSVGTLPENDCFHFMYHNCQCTIVVL